MCNDRSDLSKMDFDLVSYITYDMTIYTVCMTLCEQYFIV